MPNHDLDRLLILRHDAQRLLDSLNDDPSLSLAGYLASMLVLALAEHIADAAGTQVWSGGTKPN